MTDNLRERSLTMAEAVAATLNALPLEPGDAAMRALALEYASRIDAVPLLFPGDSSEIAAALRDERTTVLDKLGPKLQAALESLGASPKARAGIAGGGKPQGRPRSGSKLDAAREGSRQ